MFSIRRINSVHVVMLMTTYVASWGMLKAALLFGSDGVMWCDAVRARTNERRHQERVALKRHNHGQQKLGTLATLAHLGKKDVVGLEVTVQDVAGVEVVQRLRGGEHFHDYSKSL